MTSSIDMHLRVVGDERAWLSVLVQSISKYMLLLRIALHSSTEEVLPSLPTEN